MCSFFIINNYIIFFKFYDKCNLFTLKKNKRLLICYKINHVIIATHQKTIIYSAESNDGRGPQKRRGLARSIVEYIFRFFAHSINFFTSFHVIFVFVLSLHNMYIYMCVCDIYRIIKVLIQTNYGN